MLRHRSEKKEAEYKVRRELVKKVLSERVRCEACFVWEMWDAANNHEEMPAIVIEYPAQDVHELVNRSQGGSIVDERNVLAVCRPCHDRIGRQPNNAEEIGLHLRSYDNSEEGFAEAAFRRKYWRNPVEHFVV